MHGLCGTARASSRGAFFDFYQHVDQGGRELVAHQQGRRDGGQGEPYVCRAVPVVVFPPGTRVTPLVMVAVVSRCRRYECEYIPGT